MLHAGLYLIIINEHGQVVSHDGVHDKLSDVDQAYYLHTSLFPDKTKTYLGIKVQKSYPAESLKDLHAILNELYRSNPQDTFQVKASSKGVNKSAVKTVQNALAHAERNKKYVKSQLNQMREE